MVAMVNTHNIATLNSIAIMDMYCIKADFDLTLFYTKATVKCKPVVM